METVSDLKRKPRFHVSKTKVSMTFLVLLLIIAAGAFLYKTALAFDAIAFAWSKPQLVRPLHDQYSQETQSLQDSFIKRQSMVSPVTEEELKKVLSQ